MYARSKSESNVGRGDGALERGVEGDRRPELGIVGSVRGKRVATRSGRCLRDLGES